jgi:hypothetical protein
MQQVVVVLADQIRGGTAQEFHAAGVDGDDRPLLVRQVSTRSEGVQSLGNRLLRVTVARHGLPPLTEANVLATPTYGVPLGTRVMLAGVHGALLLADTLNG